MIGPAQSFTIASKAVAKPASPYTSIQWATDTVDSVSGRELRQKTLAASLLNSIAPRTIETGLANWDLSWNSEVEFYEAIRLLPPDRRDWLWKRAQTCYPGRVVDNRRANGSQAALEGYSDRFDVPQECPTRTQITAKLWDLHRTFPSEKPWLSVDTPPVIFVGSKGDPFLSKSFEDIKLNLIDPILTRERQGQLYMLRTTRPSRLLRFCEWLDREHGIDLPDNVMVGTSVTLTETVGRVRKLLQVRATWRFVTFEPIWEYVDLKPHLAPGKIDLLIAGGGSGPIATPVELSTFRRLRDDAWTTECRFFLKQLGQHVLDGGTRLTYEDRNAGDMAEWPVDLRVREFPV